MQVDPIKPMLKPPGTKRLKLNCDEPLSSFAFTFNVRPYTKVAPGGRLGATLVIAPSVFLPGGAVQVNYETHYESAWN